MSYTPVSRDATSSIATTAIPISSLPSIRRSRPRRASGGAPVGAGLRVMGSPGEDVGGGGLTARRTGPAQSRPPRGEQVGLIGQRSEERRVGRRQKQSGGARAQSAE